MIYRTVLAKVCMHVAVQHAYAQACALLLLAPPLCLLVLLLLVMLQ
jgi:hypothetical protein